MITSNLGAVRPCCGSDVGFFSAAFSNTCDYCTNPDIANQQAALSKYGDSGGGVPNCDPNASPWENAFSNSCNTSVSNFVSGTLGLPSGIPAWVYWAGLGLAAYAFLRK